MKRISVLLCCFLFAFSFACEKSEKTASVPAPPPPPVFVTQVIVDETISVPSTEYVRYQFAIEKEGNLTGNFKARGGSGNDIQVLVMSEDDYTNWKNGHKAKAFYDSDKITVGKIDLNLGPGTYSLVFNNKFGMLFAKTVEAHVKLKLKAS